MSRIRCTHFYDWSSVNEHLFEAVLNEFAENGAKELTFATLFSNNVYGDPNKAASLKRILEKTGVSMPDAHAPWGGLWDLCAPESFMRRHVVASHNLCLEILAEFGVKTYTVHIGSGDCRTNGGVFSPEMLARVSGVLEGILPTAEKLGVVVCVENGMEPSCTPDAVARCIEPFKDSPAIGCCLDVGHAHVMDPEVPRKGRDLPFNDNFDAVNWGGKLREGLVPFAEAVRRLAPYIVTTHVHDNDGIYDQHLCPGLGNCDFDAVFSELAKCPRLQSVQNETSFQASGTTIGHACRLFNGFMAKLGR